MTRKILVLGGGLGSISAAHELTKTPELRQRNQVTVLQMGWRLGGKGASGRGPHGRIEEHGLHLFFGIYEHAWQLVRELYAELGRPPTAPLATADAAFTGLDHVTMMQEFAGKSVPWTFQFPPNSRAPGEPDPDPWTWIVRLLEWLGRYLATADLSEDLSGGTAAPSRGWLDGALSSLSDAAHRAEQAGGAHLLALAARVAAELPPRAAPSPVHQALLELLERATRWLQRLVEDGAAASLPLLRLYLVLDLGLAVVRGFVRDALWLPGGLARIDGEDYRAWLRRHGASERTVASVLVNNFYQGVFTMGSGADGQLSAGVALNIQLRMFFTYKGSILYRFNAGMGEVIFAPAFEVLRRRGVEVRFFQRVLAVEADADARAIQRVRVGVQAEVVGGADYHPLREIKGLPVWPDRPDWAQLVDGDVLRAREVDFESYYTDFPLVREYTLERGRDFDELVFGIPPAALPFMAPDLVARVPGFRAAAEHLRTVPTLALQLWLRPGWRALGWTQGLPSIAGFTDPLGTIADLELQVPREDWPPAQTPGSVLYLCGYLDGPARPPVDPGPGYQASEHARVKTIAHTSVADQLGRLFPAAREPGHPDGLAWSALVDLDERSGAARLDAQYWRANVDPSARYTICAPGTNRYRMKSGETGLANCVVAGDWTDNTIYVGSAEGATISGMMAAAALAEHPDPAPAPPPIPSPTPSPSPAPTIRRERVAILGGGLGGLTAAWALSSTPELRARYDLTVHTMGWRLGGKGASGRGAHGRIEEHGVHMFFGFYDNTFAIMRDLYPALRRPAGSPLATWQDAFIRQPDVYVFQPHAGGLAPWHNVYPERPGLPGEAHPPASVWSAIRQLLDLGVERLAGSRFVGARVEQALTRPAWWERTLGDIERAVTGVQTSLGLHLMRLLVRFAATMAERAEEHRAEHHHVLIDLIDRVLAWLWAALGDVADDDIEAYRLWVAFDWVGSVIRGLLRDGLLVPEGWRKVDDIDYREWLRRHGASERTIACPLVHSYYSAVLAGALDPRIACGAGTALHTLFRIFFTYHGSFLWRMAAGMGDAVFVPFYRALKDRGVRFEFFTQVTDLVPDERGAGLQKIELALQADLVDPAAGYDPLTRVADLDTWPAEPRYDQLVQGAILRSKNLNLESYYDSAAWPAVGRRTLERGRDFDRCVFAIPGSAAPFAAPSLVARSPRWRRMCARVKTIQTQSFQLWLTRSVVDLGWATPSTFATTWVEPVDTWSDMSLTIAREAWPAGHAPAGVAYFTGFMDGPEHAPPIEQPNFFAEQQELARAAMRRYVERDLGSLWPRGAVGPGLDWNILVDPAQRSGAERLDAQFWKANVDPWDRYVLSAPGTNGDRIGPGTELDNLVVAGDWTDNGFYSGAAEGAVISGLLAARTLSGVAFPILGADQW